MLPRLHILACLPLLMGAVWAVEPSESFTWTDADHALNLYCYECHGGFSTEGDLDLVNINQQNDLQAHPEKWLKVLESLRTHYMPHPDGRDLPPHRRAQLVDKIGSELMALSADYDPASASLRRLNRVEYNNTLNDLFFIQGDWAASLPADDAGYGFDNIAAALNFSPLLMERYFDVAARVAVVAVPQKVPSEERSLSASNFTGGNRQGAIRRVVSRGERSAVRQRIFFPGNGQYTLGLLLSADQAGNENARAELWLDGQRIGESEVEAKAGDAPELDTFTVTIQQAGEHQVEVRFVNDYYQKTETGHEDRNLIFHGLELKGPEQNAEALQSPFLDRHFGSLPERLSFKELKDGIHRFASRAYRRPVTNEEVALLWEGSDWNVRQGLYGVIDAVLTSPAFLFRLERETGALQHDSFALASWLSYFLWSSMPDDRLFDLALRRQLHTKLESEVERMLADPRAVALAENFAGQWWRFRDLDIVRPDRSVYEGADDSLLAAMREETQRFFVHVLKEDRPLLDFLNADYSFINEALARHYGIQGVKGKHFRKVSLAGTPRRGIWSQAGILTVTSYPNHTSPVLRGQWILQNLIGLAPPPPPDNVPSLPGTEGNPNPDDLRASLAQHRDNPDCASCHDIMDPFGLALEHFDGVGALRSLAERKQLSEETLFDGVVIRDPVDLARYFEAQRSEDFIRNVARKLSIYASGRGLDWRDEVALQRMAEYTRARDFRFTALVQSVVNEFAPVPKTVSFSQVESQPDPRSLHGE